MPSSIGIHGFQGECNCTFGHWHTENEFRRKPLVFRFEMRGEINAWETDDAEADVSVVFYSYVDEVVPGFADDPAAQPRYGTNDVCARGGPFDIVKAKFGFLHVSGKSRPRRERVADVAATNELRDSGVARKHGLFLRGCDRWRNERLRLV